MIKSAIASGNYFTIEDAPDRAGVHSTAVLMAQ
jgi:hypothetical protein